MHCGPNQYFLSSAHSKNRPTIPCLAYGVLGLELLGRAALASVSPTLLAEPDKEHRYLLQALGRAVQNTTRRSIGAAQVFNLCRTLFDGFTEEDRAAALALINR